MSETRISASFHFVINPAHQTIGLIELPQTLILTYGLGSKVLAEKVSLEQVPCLIRERLEVEIAQLVLEQTRTAKPLAAPIPSAMADPTETATPQASEPEGEMLFNL